MEVCDAFQARAAWLQALEMAEQRVMIMAYTFDLPDIVEALCDAGLRGVRVRALIDRRSCTGGPKRNQQSSIQQLQRHRVEV